ncbi:flagellar biosynthesis regulator FlaF [Azospirillum halopraeferens]|uniref:flagellar biosynthesis regulator FlaF n=1 Tax=Azospirillum halopraeferens TaxID=34010 RepID=UPI0004234B6C|nr:flagellar biosynthesis regulator FlaF [Azospirillum halopraeferens]
MKPTPKYTSRPTSDDPRDVEAWALAEAARRLIDAGRAPSNGEALQAALQLNQRLWTIFQASISEDDCPLPQDLRTNIAALSLMVDRETMARLADLDATKLDRLIEINRSVSSGLSQKVEGTAPRAATTTQAAPAAAAPQPAPVAPRPVPQQHHAAQEGAQPQPLRISI